MAQVTDPRAAGFNSATVRDALRLAMMIGTPNATEERVTFRWSGVAAYPVADPAADPYDWTEQPQTEITHDDVQVPVAVEVGGAATDESNAAGTFDNTKAVITILDDDYEQVRGADQIIFANKTYGIDSVVPLGLFDLTVYQLHIVETG